VDFNIERLFKPAVHLTTTKMARIFLFISSLVLFVSAVVADPINEWCPVTPTEPAESHLTVEFEGQTIGFCCRACIRKFLESPETYRTNLPAPEPTGGSATSAKPEISPPERSLAERAWRLLGNLHVLAIHFPIALLLISAPLEVVAALRRSAQWAFAARINFSVGAVAALAAAVLGWIAAANSNYTGEAASLLEWHRWLGTSVAIIALCGAFGLAMSASRPRWGSWVYWICLALICVMIPIAAHLGGSMIYGTNHLSL